MVDTDLPDALYEENDTTVLVEKHIQKLSELKTTANSTQVTLTVASHFNYFLLRRLNNGNFSTHLTDISATTAAFSYANKNLEEIQKTIYAVNSSKDFYKIDETTGTVELITTLEEGSIANTVDRLNKRVYIAYNDSPFNLIYYDIETGSFHEVMNLEHNFPRMAFNHEDGYIYYCRDNGQVYVVDPESKQYIKNFELQGVSEGWGDFDFNADGELYLATKKGIYHIDL